MFLFLLLVYEKKIRLVKDTEQLFWPNSTYAQIVGICFSLVVLYFYQQASHLRIFYRGAAYIVDLCLKGFIILEVITLLSVPFKCRFHHHSDRLISQVEMLISRKFSLGWLTCNEGKSPHSCYVSPTNFLM